MRCQQCGHEFEALPGEPCPRCGHSAPVAPSSPPEGASYIPPSAPEPHAGGPPPPPPEPPRAGIPWERERSLGSLLQTLQGVLIQPTRTFQEADPAAGIGWALGYAMLLGMIGGTFSAAFSAAWDLLMRRAGLGNTEFLESLPPELEEIATLLSSPLASLLSLVFLPFLILFSLFLSAAIVHLMLLMVGGAKRGFEATFRVVAYAQGGVSLFTIVPFVGPIAGFLWSFVIQMIGLAETHRIVPERAAIALLLPLLFCLCCCGAVILFGGLSTLIAAL